MTSCTSLRPRSIRTILIAALLALLGLAATPAAQADDKVVALRRSPHTLLVVGQEGAALGVSTILDTRWAHLPYVTVSTVDPAALDAGADPLVVATEKLAEPDVAVLVVELDRDAYPLPAEPEDTGKKKKRSKFDPEAEQARFETAIAPRMAPVLDAAGAAGVDVIWIAPPPPPPEEPETGKKKKKKKKGKGGADAEDLDLLAAVIQLTCDAHEACDPLVHKAPADQPVESAAAERSAWVGSWIVAVLDARLDFGPPPPPHLWDDQGFLLERAAEVEVIPGAHWSAKRNKEVGYSVYQPDVGDPYAKYPVLYLLHGAYDGHTAWPDHADEDLRSYAAEHGLIIVTPDGDPFGWYLDSPIDENSQIESYLFGELIPLIEDEYPVLPSKRAIAGLSMGGHGALSLALRHPGDFVSASSMSGVLDLTRHEDSPEVVDRIGLLDEFRERYEAVSVTHLMQAAPADLGGMRIYFSCGKEDRRFIEENRDLSAMLVERNTPHVAVFSEGKHSWAYWVAQLEDHVRFHAEILVGDGVR